MKTCWTFDSNNWNILNGNGFIIFILLWLWVFNCQSCNVTSEKQSTDHPSNINCFFDNLLQSWVIIIIPCRVSATRQFVFSGSDRFLSLKSYIAFLHRIHPQYALIRPQILHGSRVIIKHQSFARGRHRRRGTDGRQLTDRTTDLPRAYKRKKLIRPFACQRIASSRSDNITINLVVVSVCLSLCLGGRSFVCFVMDGPIYVTVWRLRHVTYVTVGRLSVRWQIHQLDSCKSPPVLLNLLPWQLRRTMQVYFHMHTVICGWLMQKNSDRFQPSVRSSQTICEYMLVSLDWQSIMLEDGRRQCRAYALPLAIVNWTFNLFMRSELCFVFYIPACFG